ncbi:MAG TPA: hypothetical protein VFY16_03260, partial [Gemmatimonadaceae bacterium]|nr:hypothetical protein [Gemmatimonadaceae bacterium]
MTALLLLALLVVLTVWLTVRAEATPPARARVVNPSGARGTALVVHHPGLSDFPGRVTDALARGLATQGWRVELATATPRAPAHPSRADLLVLVAPTYWWAPARPVVRWVDQAGDLRGTPTVVVVTAAGQSGRSRRVLEARVRAAGGRLLAARELYTWAPNDEAHYDASR